MFQEIIDGVDDGAGQILSLDSCRAGSPEIGTALPFYPSHVLNSYLLSFFVSLLGKSFGIYRVLASIDSINQKLTMWSGSI